MTKTTTKLVKRGDGELRLVVATVSEFVPEIDEDLVKLGREQYEAERQSAGDPPYSLGNEWLLALSNKWSDDPATGDVEVRE